VTLGLIFQNPVTNIDEEPASHYLHGTISAGLPREFIGPRAKYKCGALAYN